MRDPACVCLASAGKYERGSIRVASRTSARNRGEFVNACERVGRVCGGVATGTEEGVGLEAESRLKGREGMREED